ncbi:hypothetical protein Pint_13953 [Pistacia integerrima]|uniref:Uncharacterized protein n=1 Tax=Pistacia integerrima TaxID=434235 RepID=A0ACC0Y9R0_9ROSI|nr:hypothetical protein Pint_13953 [Pistacia integerrima]
MGISGRWVFPIFIYFLFLYTFLIIIAIWFSIYPSYSTNNLFLLPAKYTLNTVLHYLGNQKNK